MTRARGITEEAAEAAVDTACRVLRLPTIRGQFTGAADKAEREQLTYRRFLAELLMADVVLPAPYAPGDEEQAMAMLRAPLETAVRTLVGPVDRTVATGHDANPAP